MHHGAQALGKPPGSVRVRRCPRRPTLRAGGPRMRQASRFESGRATRVTSVCEGRGGGGHGASLPVRQAHRWSPCRWRVETPGKLGRAASQHSTTSRRGDGLVLMRRLGGQWPYHPQHGEGARAADVTGWLLVAPGSRTPGTGRRIPRGGRLQRGCRPLCRCPVGAGGGGMDEGAQRGHASAQG